MNVTEKIKIGLKREEHGVSDEAHSAQALGSGLLPVLATPAMTALMEQAAANMLEEFLRLIERNEGENLMHTFWIFMLFFPRDQIILIGSHRILRISE